MKDGETGYSAFLLAKRAIDARSYNAGVWEAAARHLAPRGPHRPVRVLELGAGVGGMLERILACCNMPLLHYEVVDLEPSHGEALRAEVRAFAERGGYRMEEGEEGFVLEKEGEQVRIRIVIADVFDYCDRHAGRRFDLVIGQAFLDLFDIDRLMPRLLALIEGGGGGYFPITFDGVSAWLPVLDESLDDRIEALYHASIDARRARDEKSRRSRCGRHVAYWLARHPAVREMKAGGSDWVVGGSDAQGLTRDERNFLQALLDGYENELRGHSALRGADFEGWLQSRRRTVEDGTAFFLAHQLDVYVGTHFSVTSRERDDL
ncbi:MAG: hypothetical protein R2834_00015 [Rhodothermales bacterium]